MAGGTVALEVTVLSVLVLARLPLPARSVTLPAAMDGVRVPLRVRLVAARVKVLWSPESVIVQLMPEAVPDWVISAVVNEATLSASENTTVKLIGKLAVGSAWPFAWLTVTVGAVFSYMTDPPALVLASLLFPA